MNASSTISSIMIPQLWIKEFPMSIIAPLKVNFHQYLGDFNVLVMDLMGPSLESLFNQT